MSTCITCHVTYEHNKKIIKGNSREDVILKIKSAFELEEFSIQKYHDHPFNDWVDIETNDIENLSKLKVMRNLNMEERTDTARPTQVTPTKSSDSTESTSPTTKPATCTSTSKSATSTPTTKSATSTPTTKPATSTPTTKPGTSTPTTKPATSTPTTKPGTSTPTTKPATSTPTTKRGLLTLLPWHVPYRIPVEKFRPNLMAALAEGKGKLEFHESTCLISALYDDMTKYTFRPTPTQYSEVISRLLARYPSLINGLPGLDANVYWKDKLSQRFRNERGRHERNNPLAQRVKKVKKSSSTEIRNPQNNNKWGVKHYLPHRPLGEDDVSIKKHIDHMKVESEKKKQDSSKIRLLMEITFADRRQGIVNSLWKVGKVMEEYPCLFDDEEIVMEFNRLTDMSLTRLMDDGLEKYGRAILECGTEKNPVRQDIYSALSQARTSDIKKRLTAVGALLLLPSLLREKPEIIISPDTMDLEDSHAHIRYEGTVKGILEDAVEEFEVLAEGVVVCTTKDVLRAFSCLIATHYVFNMVYHKKVEATYMFIQKIILNIKDTSPTPKKLVKLLFEVNSKLT